MSVGYRHFEDFFRARGSVKAALVVQSLDDVESRASVSDAS
jgi:hypothetical protein